MEIKSYPDASLILEKDLKSYVKSSIECWWSDPFAELMMCIDEKCWSIYSIQDVYWSVEDYRNRKEDKEFKCECGCDTELMYKPEEFIELVKEYVKGEVSVVLLMVDDEVEGFWVLSKWKLRDVMYSSLNWRPDSWNIEESISALSEKLFWIVDWWNKEVVCSHQIYVSPKFREGNITLDILKKLFSINPSFEWLPIVWETRFNSKFYPITRAKWYKDLVHDKYGSVLQYAENFSEINNFYQNVSSFSDKWLFSEIIKYKRESKKILANNPDFLKRKKYI